MNYEGETIKQRKIKSQNIVDRLRHREIWGARKPGTNAHVAHQFALSIFPNLSIPHVDKPRCFLRKFSPDGRYLIAFSEDQTSLEIYQYLGCAMAGDLIKRCNKEVIIEDPNSCTRDEHNIRSQIFNRLFKVKFIYY